MAGFDLSQITGAPPTEPQDASATLAQNAYASTPPWRANYSNVAPIAQQAIEGPTTTQATQQTSSMPWRADYNNVAPIAQQAIDGTTTALAAQQSSSVPWRANYNNVAPIAQQAIDGTTTAQPTQQTPIIYEPGTSGNPTVGAPPSYDTGTYGTPPNPSDTPSSQGPAFNPGPDGGASGNGDPNTYPPNYAFQPARPGSQTQPQQPGAPAGGSGPFPTYPSGGNSSPDTGSYEAPKANIGVLPAAILGGIGGYAGGRLIPKLVNPAADSLMNTTSAGAGATGIAESAWAKKLLPQSWRDNIAASEARLGARADALNAQGAAKRLAEGWQDNFNPQFARRTTFTDMLDKNTASLDSLVTKSGLTADEATRLGTLQYARNQFEAAKAAGERVGRFKGLKELNTLKAKSSLTDAENTDLANLQARQNLLTDPAKAGELNAKIFNPTDGPALLKNMEKAPFTEDEMKVITGQQKVFSDAEAAANVDVKTLPYLQRPGVADFAKGAALVGGGMLASSWLDSVAGGPNALHIDNYGIPMAFLAGDSVQQKAVYMGGTVVGNFLLDKMLPASDHATISNIMRPSGWDAAMQGAAFLLPAADNKVRLATMAGAWGVGRLANMSFLPSTLVTGAGAGITGYLLRRDPELALGAITLEVGAWGVSRIMHEI